MIYEVEKTIDVNVYISVHRLKWKDQILDFAIVSKGEHI
jgi:hypothetical protein